ncbi:MAG: prephenate dehydratase [candidate division NC10 bacterium]|nr:prephenate dehydratase [candidate division NC10 bacterium]
MTLEDLRKRIDAIDEQILKLLSERAAVVQEIGQLKLREGLDFHAPQREEEILERLTQQNPGPFPETAVRSVYREIISACRSLEHPLGVAYLGPRATFTHLACLKRFGDGAEFLPVRSIRDVFLEVEKGKVEYGVVPIENSTEGVVSHTLDMFVDSDLKICGEILLEVSHHLLSKSGEKGAIEKIYSHPHAIAQSRRWLEANVPHVPVLEVASTAAAAEIASREPAAAAIASELAARLYGLTIVSARIEDAVNNFTRFLIVGRKPAPRTGHDKTSILFSIKDRIGALYRMLAPFADGGINLTKIESRPSKTKVWEYLFYVDFEGHGEDAAIREALSRLADHCLFLKVLGSYPGEKRRAPSL